MCGIIGIVGSGAVAPRVLAALARLEYRGYDSAGIATLEAGALKRCRSIGKIDQLSEALGRIDLRGAISLGHTRWATHGLPSVANAHPHATDRVAVVHNGIIENFRDLRALLVDRGAVFASATDTEVVAHLVTDRLDAGATPIEAVLSTLPLLRGAYALGFLFDGEERFLVAARRGAPLSVAEGIGESYLGSDAIALADLATGVRHLEDGDCAVLTRHGIAVIDGTGRRVDRASVPLGLDAIPPSRRRHRHHMAREMEEQPDAVARTISSFSDARSASVRLPSSLLMTLDGATRLSFTGCGSAYLAALAARPWFETMAGIPIDLDLASEYRYRDPPVSRGTVCFGVSQSGETADTLGAMRLDRLRGRPTVALVNVPSSTMAREADVALATLAGPEIGVASTKAFTCQLATLACLAIGLGRLRGTIDAEREASLVEALKATPRLLAETLSDWSRTGQAARVLSKARDVLYVGRGVAGALAHEGALKLKELSYLHAEAYAAGEMKHGPIALVDSELHAVVVAPPDDLFVKTASNAQELAARGARIIVVGAPGSAVRMGLDEAIEVPGPADPSPFSALPYVALLQLMAYQVAVLSGRDVDRPRNLAKCVTVE